VLSVPLGVLAGRRLEPVQRTALHQRHQQAGATWMDAGMWRRPRAYGAPAEECRAVREGVGIIDVSTLGKLDLQGSDAARLLEKIYTHRFANLSPGRVRYAIASDDSGIVLDDGTVARLGKDRWFVTTTTSGIGQMEAWLRWWAEGTGWCAHVTNVTSTYAALNLAGPRAREVLARLTPLDVSASALPYLAVAEGQVAGIPTLLLRIGFVGELGYEMHFPADYGEAMWDALMDAGAEFGIRPFGVEAQRILRLEKGHIIVAQDTDALTTVLEAEMAWACKFDKEDFVGRSALQRLQEQGLRQKLVGFEVPGGELPNEGDQIVDPGNRPVGRVTSARRSPTLARVIGLAWLPLHGGTTAAEFSIRSNGQVVKAKVVPTPFYDRDGSRMRS
jgi:sarcosine oxidase subunit alpha